MHPRLCISHKEKFVLCPNPTFVPKVNTVFDKAQELILPSFFLKPVHPREKLSHTFDVRRALWFYRERTKDLRKLISRVPLRVPMLDKRSSTSFLARWLRACIMLANRQGMTIHLRESLCTPLEMWLLLPRLTDTLLSMRSAEQSHGLWSLVCIFVKQYKVDMTASAKTFLD